VRTLIAALSLGIATSAFGQVTSTGRPSDTLVVSFALIRADNSGQSDPSLGGLDSTLRRVLRFTGYRGIGGAASLAFPGKTFDLTFVTAKPPIDPRSIPLSKRVRVFCTVEHLTNDTSPATAQLRINLSSVDSATNRPAGPDIFSAGLTIPENHVVVVGSGAYGDDALVLTVRWRKGSFSKKE
jgi:hypothetical protein